MKNRISHKSTAIVCMIVLVTMSLLFGSVSGCTLGVSWPTSSILTQSDSITILINSPNIWSETGKVYILLPAQISLNNQTQIFQCTDAFTNIPQYCSVQQNNTISFQWRKPTNIIMTNTSINLSLKIVTPPYYQNVYLALNYKENNLTMESCDRSILGPIGASGFLTQASLKAANPTVQFNTTYNFTFLLTNALGIGSYIRITFPNTVYIPNGPCTARVSGNSSKIAFPSFTICSVAVPLYSTIGTVSISNFSLGPIAASTVIVIEVDNFMNPRYCIVTSSFLLQTFMSGNSSSLDVSVANDANMKLYPQIYEGAVQNFNFSRTNSVNSAAVNFVLRYRPTLAFDSSDRLLFVLPLKLAGAINNKTMNVSCQSPNGTITYPSFSPTTINDKGITWIMIGLFWYPLFSKSIIVINIYNQFNYQSLKPCFAVIQIAKFFQFSASPISTIQEVSVQVTNTQMSSIGLALTDISKSIINGDLTRYNFLAYSTITNNLVNLLSLQILNPDNYSRPYFTSTTVCYVYGVAMPCFADAAGIVLNISIPVLNQFYIKKNISIVLGNVVSPKIQRNCQVGLKVYQLDNSTTEGNYYGITAVKFIIAAPTVFNAIYNVYFNVEEPQSQLAQNAAFTLVFTTTNRLVNGEYAVILIPQQYTYVATNSNQSLCSKNAQLFCYCSDTYRIIVQQAVNSSYFSSINTVSVTIDKNVYLSPTQWSNYTAFQISTFSNSNEEIDRTGANSPTFYLTCSNIDNHCRTCDNSSKCLSCYGFGSYVYMALNNTCVTVCDSNQFINDTTCVKCDSSCLTCENTSTFCLSCDLASTLQYFYNNKCLSSCPAKTMTNASLCLNCSSQCNSCEIDVNNCTSCFNSFLFGNTCVNQSSCPVGLFGNTDNWICTVCHQSCFSCIGNATRCTKCTNGYIFDKSLGLSFPGKCTNICPYGTANSSVLNDSLSDGGCYCNATICKTCQYSINNCLQCADLAVSLNSVCVTDCGAGFYPDSYKICQSCNSSCIACVSQFVCSECSIGFIVDVKFNTTLPAICTDICPDGKVNDTLRLYGPGVGCRCNPLCQECYSTLDNCTKCANSSFNESGICVAQCGINYYHVNQICLSCNASCKGCVSKYLCIQCADGYIVDMSYNNTISPYYCTDQCPPGKVNDTDNSSQFRGCRCDWQCSTCVGTVDNCTACSDTAFNLSNSCVAQCGVGYYFVGDVRICLKCHQSCIGCQLFDLCKQCAVGYIIDKSYNNTNSSFRCTNICPPGTVNNTDNKTYFKGCGCHQLCSTCNGTVDNCLTCSNISKIQQNVCVYACSWNYYQVGSNCIKCNASCKGCLDSIYCQKCADGFIIDHDYNNSGSYARCTDICPIGTVNDTANGNGCSCNATICSTCAITVNNCTKCAQSAKILNGICVTQCGLDYYPNDSKVCELCNASCSGCQSKYQCFNCAFGFIIDMSYNNTVAPYVCTDVCPPGKVNETDGKGCKQCNSLCNLCEITVNNCTECSSTAFNLSNICVADCGIDYYSMDRICRPCDKSCAGCKSQYLCFKCAQGYIIDMDYNNTIAPFRCTDVCPPGTVNDTGRIYGKGCLCGPLCSRCSISVDNCTQCSTKAFILNDTCLAVCPLGYYVLDHICLICPVTCLNCLSESVCLKCKSIYNYTHHGLCFNECPHSTFPVHNQQQSYCDVCSFRCHQCNSSTYCFSCQNGSMINVEANQYNCTTLCPTNKLVFQYQCIYNCPDNYYAENGTCTNASVVLAAASPLPVASTVAFLPFTIMLLLCGSVSLGSKYWFSKTLLPAALSSTGGLTEVLCWMVLVVLMGANQSSPSFSTLSLYSLMIGLLINLALNILGVYFFMKYIWTDDKFQKQMNKLKKTSQLGSCVPITCIIFSILFSHKCLQLLFSNLFQSNYLIFKVNDSNKFIPQNYIRYLSFISSLLAIVSALIVAASGNGQATNILYMQSIDCLIVTVVSLLFGAWATVRKSDEYQNIVSDKELEIMSDVYIGNQESECSHHVSEQMVFQQFEKEYREENSPKKYHYNSSVKQDEGKILDQNHLIMIRPFPHDIIQEVNYTNDHMHEKDEKEDDDGDHLHETRITAKINDSMAKKQKGQRYNNGEEEEESNNALLPRNRHLRKTVKLNKERKQTRRQAQFNSNEKQKEEERQELKNSVEMKLTPTETHSLKCLSEAQNIHTSTLTDYQNQNIRDSQNSLHQSTQLQKYIQKLQKISQTQQKDLQQLTETDRVKCIKIKQALSLLSRNNISIQEYMAYQQITEQQNDRHQKENYNNNSSPNLDEDTICEGKMQINPRDNIVWRGKNRHSRGRQKRRGDRNRFVEDDSQFRSYEPSVGQFGQSPIQRYKRYEEMEPSQTEEFNQKTGLKQNPNSASLTVSMPKPAKSIIQSINESDRHLQQPDQSDLNNTKYPVRTVNQMDNNILKVRTVPIPHFNNIPESLTLGISHIQCIETDRYEQDRQTVSNEDSDSFDTYNFEEPADYKMGNQIVDETPIKPILRHVNFRFFGTGEKIDGEGDDIQEMQPSEELNNQFKDGKELSTVMGNYQASNRKVCFEMKEEREEQMKYGEIQEKQEAGEKQYKIVQISRHPPNKNKQKNHIRRRTRVTGSSKNIPSKK